jgi:hypothetical protein
MGFELFLNYCDQGERCGGLRKHKVGWTVHVWALGLQSAVSYSLAGQPSLLPADETFLHLHHTHLKSFIREHIHAMAPLPVPTKADSQTLSEAVKSTDSSFQVLYFGLHARGELTRNILSYSGAKWEELTPVSQDGIFHTLD